MTRILILDGHPAKDTFCQALGDAYAHSAWNNGHEVRVRHLSGMAFNPDFGQSTFFPAPGHGNRIFRRSGTISSGASTSSSSIPSGGAGFPPS
ncbi:NAD(P)H-dependent oxidoreductase [Roseibium salinum]|nr:NAD(P)H-dependent oxidoreductase [Roseibium salinum]